MMSLSRRKRLGAAATAAAAALLLSMSTGSAAQATALASTPVPVTFPEGSIVSYVVNVGKANPGQVRKAEKAVVDAGGVVVQSWPEIGVIVAHSTSSTFKDSVVKAGKNSIDSVGATRTVPVAEGTPAGAQAPWGPGASDWTGAQEPANGDIAAPPAPATTTDPREGEQWDMKMIKADQAHQITDGSRNVLVGVLDSGIDPDHPDLAANIDVENSVNCTAAGRPDTTPLAWAPVKSDHGTHVAGTIAAARNGVGIVGVAPGVRVASVRVSNAVGITYPEYAVCGFMWAAQHDMDVTNNSYYVDPYMYWCQDQPDQAASFEAVRRAVAYSHERGVVNVAASGNSNKDRNYDTTDKTSPSDSKPILRDLDASCTSLVSSLPDVLSVSSVNKVKTLTYLSNRGLNLIDIAAPGSSVLSTIIKDNGWGTKTGTSMAAPHVAGVLALMKSVHPDWTPDQLTEKLLADATDMPCSPAEYEIGQVCEGTPEYNSYYGEGIVDALKAVS